MIIIELESLLNAGSLYWRNSSVSMEEADVIALEAEIQGRLHSVNALFENISKEFSDSLVSSVRISISELRQTLTGGQFGASARHSSSGSIISKSFIVSAELRVRLEGCLRHNR
jgi:hypothetical protein